MTTRPPALIKIMNAVVHAFFTLVIFDLRYFHPSLTLQLTMDFMCSNCGYALISIFFIWVGGWFKQTIVRTKFKSKHQPRSIQADTNFKHASALLVAQLDEIFHHPDNKEILHTNVLASALLVTIEVTNLWQKKQFSHLTLIQKVTPSTSGAFLLRNMTKISSSFMS